MEFSWGFHHRNDPMPPQVTQRAQRFGRYVLWLRNGLVVAIVLGLARHQSLRFWQIGLRLDGWRPNSLIGIAAGFMSVGLQRLSRRLYPRLDIKDKRLAAEPAANWILITIGLSPRRRALDGLLCHLPHSNRPFDHHGCFITRNRFWCPPFSVRI